MCIPGFPSRKGPMSSCSGKLMKVLSFFLCPDCLQKNRQIEINFSKWVGERYKILTQAVNLQCMYGTGLCEKTTEYSERLFLDYVGWCLQFLDPARYCETFSPSLCDKGKLTSTS